MDQSPTLQVHLNPVQQPEARPNPYTLLEPNVRSGQTQPSEQPSNVNPYAAYKQNPQTIVHPNPNPNPQPRYYNSSSQPIVANVNPQAVNNHNPNNPQPIYYNPSSQPIVMDFNLQAAYGNPNSQPAYPQYTGQNPPAGYPQPYGNAYPQGQYLPPSQTPFVMPLSNVRDLETRIETDYCYYLCLVYFELIITSIGLIYECIIFADFEVPGLIIVALITSAPMISACVLALMAKSSLDLKKQNIAFILFIVSTVLTAIGFIITLVIFGFPYSLIATIVQLVIGCILIYGAHAIKQLMIERNGALQPFVGIPPVGIPVSNVPASGIPTNSIPAGGNLPSNAANRDLPFVSA